METISIVNDIVDEIVTCGRVFSLTPKRPSQSCNDDDGDGDDDATIMTMMTMMMMSFKAHFMNNINKDFFKNNMRKRNIKQIL